jgi:hypothetical protein
MRRFLEVFLVVGLVVTACSGGDATTTSVTSHEATTSSTTLPVTTNTTTTVTNTTTTVTTTSGAVVSPDPLAGVEWSRVPHDEAVFGGPGGQIMTSVTVGGPGFVAVGSGDADGGDRHAAVWTSLDGRVWSRVPHDEAVFGGSDGQRMRSVTAGGPGLVAVGWDSSGDDEDAAVWTSTDGWVWSRVPHDEAVFGGPGDQWMLWVTSGGPGLVAVGQAQSDDGDRVAAVWTSTDGRVWSRVPHDETVFGDATMWSVTAGGPGLVAVGDGDWAAAVWTSSDGRVWSRVSHDEKVFGGQGMLSVTVGGPGLVAVGHGLGAAVWTSTDGRVWSRVPHDESVFGGPDIQEMRSVTAGGPGLVAVGGAWSEAVGWVAAVWTSTDGRVWSRVPHDRAVFDDGMWMQSVTAGGPGLVAVGWQHGSGLNSDAAVWVSPPE